MKYRKKPVVVEAMPVPPDDSMGQLEAWGRLAAWLGSGSGTWRVTGRGYADKLGIEIDTPEGKMLARPGDWIIRDATGELLPYKPDVFWATYEPAD